MKKQTPEIKHILFDIGNVLLVDTEKTFDEIFHKNKLAPVDKDLYEKTIHQTERGEKPVAELLKVMKKVYKLAFTTKQLETLMTQPGLIEPMWKLANALRKNYSVEILTNNQKNWPEIQARNVGVSFKKFKVFNSAHLGMRKPGSEIYEYVQKKLKAKPEEILFIDDREYNLVEPEKLGWNTIHFTGNVGAVIKALKKLGVKVKI